MDATDDPSLLSVAASITDGAPVDWTRLRSGAKDVHAVRVLREMVVLELIANFHRDAELPALPPADPSEPIDGEPRAWGRFANLVRLGEGSFGVVYHAFDTRLQKDVALKLLHTHTDGSFDVQRALEEARMLARVRHPNVVTVFDTEFVDGRVGIWMEFVKGGSLETLLRTHGSLSAREAALIGFDLCRALAAVHAAGLVHGDIKAQNVMREEGGRTVLMDFGAGKDVQARPNGPDFAGTPLYVAPEIFTGQPRTPASDIYSLGVLLYHLVTNDYPVPGATRADVERRHAARERRYLRDTRPDLPADFVRVVEKATAERPADRYQTAGAFEAALGEFLGRPVPSRRPPIAVIAAAAVALAGAATYIGLTRGRAASPPAATTTDVAARTAPPPVAAGESTYEIDTAFFRAAARGEDRLDPGARVAPGDRLFARVRVSTPAYVYIVNEDDRGDSYLLFPLPGQPLANPLPAGITHRIPNGTAEADTVNWQVTSAGGREHFLVFASPERITAFEQLFSALPHPEVGRPVLPAAISRDGVGRLRSVGGLAPAAPRDDAAKLSLQFATPLGNRAETARGLWVRQLTVDNPVK